MLSLLEEKLTAMDLYMQIQILQNLVNHGTSFISTCVEMRSGNAVFYLSIWLAALGFLFFFFSFNTSRLKFTYILLKF